jgi:hypothetical protein
VTNERNNFVLLFLTKIKSTEVTSDTINREIGTCVNVNEANVQEIANAEIREHSDDILDEEVNKSSSNAGEKPNDLAVVSKLCKSMLNDEKYLGT